MSDESGSDSSSDDEGPFKKKKPSKAKALDLHHRFVLSHLKNSRESTDGGNKLTYACLLRRVRTAATFRVYEAWEKKMGKMYFVKRNIFVPSYEYLEVTLSDSKKTWCGKILFAEHNVDRMKATRDDTWEEDEFLDTVQRALQFPKGNENLSIYISETKEDHSLHSRLHLEIREKVDGVTTSFVKPVELTETAENMMRNASFLATARALALDQLARLVRTGKFTKAQELVDEGYAQVHALSGEHQTGWCALQWAAHAGQRKALLWLLDEQKVDPLSKSKDGWTAMHCACKMGHFEVAKVLYEHGCSLHASTTGKGDGQTPLTLMMENKHMGMVRYFLGESSKFAQEAYAANGTRIKEMPPDMYLTLKPLPPEVLKEIKRALKVKLKQVAERKEQEAREARAAAGIAEPESAVRQLTKTGGKSSKGGGGNKKGGASPSPSASPSRAGTASKRDESPTSSVGSKTSKSSPSPPKRK